jgi:GNAT superfamily N-acetyltransferase
MRYSCHDLSAVRVHFLALCRIQDVWPDQRYMAGLRDLADRGARVVIARDGFRVVGSVMFLPAAPLPKVANIPGLDLSLERFEILRAGLLVGTNVFVDPDFRGSGVASEMWRFVSDDARPSGFTHSIWAFYETPAILSWVAGFGGSLASGVEDGAGDPVYFVKLS